MFYPEPKPAPCVNQRWDNELNEYLCGCSYDEDSDECRICDQESLTSCFKYEAEERNTEPLEH